MHTYNDQEVDAIIGDAKVAIEIKSSEEVKTRHKNGLKAFKEEHPDCRLILVSLEESADILRRLSLFYLSLAYSILFTNFATAVNFTTVKFY